MKEKKEEWEIDIENGIDPCFGMRLPMMEVPIPRTYTALEMEDAFLAGERSFRLRNNPDAKFVKFPDWLQEHNLNHKP